MDSHEDKNPEESLSKPDTSHLLAPANNVRTPKRKFTIIAGAVVAIVIIICSIGSGLYYLKKQNDKKSDSLTSSVQASDANLQTPEERIAVQLTASLQKELGTLEEDNPVATIENDSAAVQHVIAMPDATTNQCSEINTFALSNASAQQAFEAQSKDSLETSLSVLQMTWKLEDTSTLALRNVSEGSFLNLAKAFSDTPGLNTMQKAAATAYSTLLINSVHKLDTDVDAAEAAYRDDTLALEKSHQASLSTLDAVLVSSITSATATAQKNCNETGAAATLTAAITSANTSFNTKVSAVDAQSISDETKIVDNRDTVFLDQNTQFSDNSLVATQAITASILNGKAFTD